MIFKNINSWEFELATSTTNLIKTFERRIKELFGEKCWVFPLYGFHDVKNVVLKRG
jgi:hypothetical protein